VRCSNCHHRFHVVPSAESEEPAGNDSVVAEVPEPPPAAEPGAEPDLDNPEFLFDDEPDLSTSTLPTGVRDFAEGGISLSNEVTQMHEVGQEGGEFSEASLGDPEAPAPAGKRGATPVFGMDPEVSARQQQMLGGESPGDESSFAVVDTERALDLGSAGDETGSLPTLEPPAMAVEPSSDPHLAAEAPAAEPAPPAEMHDDPGAAAVDPGDIDDAIRTAFDDDDDPLGEWDPLADPGVAAAAARRQEPPAPVEIPASEATATPSQGIEAPTDIEDDAPTDAPWVRIAAAIVGVLLVAGAARQSLLHAAAVPGPPAVQGAGWTARDIRVDPARDLAGQRMLLVRGRLESAGAAPPPRVRAELLDPSGAVLGELAEGVVLRHGQSAPDAAALERLQRASSPLTGQVVGFVVPLHTPDPRAHRVRIRLENGSPTTLEAQRPSAAPPSSPASDPDPAATGTPPAAPSP
jgi:hypothetical protein